MARKQTKAPTRQHDTQPPKLLAYHVAERGEKKFWTRIGAAWDHKDGEGWTIQLDLVPVGAGRIVLRPARDEAQDQDHNKESAKADSDAGA